MPKQDARVIEILSLYGNVLVSYEIVQMSVLDCKIMKTQETCKICSKFDMSKVDLQLLKL